MPFTDLTRSLTAELHALASRFSEERSGERLRAALSNGCWIYGAGGYGKLVRQLLERAGLPCLGFIDRRGDNPEFKAAFDVPVQTPAEVQATQPAVIIAVQNYADDTSDVVHWARTCFSTVLTAGDLPDALGEEAGGYWLTSRSHTVRHLPDIADLMARMGDEESVRVVASVARFRLTSDILLQPQPDRANQYLPPFLGKPVQPACFIDGGAYDGDTFRALRRAGVQVSEWYAFEPDLENFAKLTAMSGEAGATKVALFPCGLGARTEDLTFSDGEGAGSRIAEGAGTSKIRVVALDQVLHGVRPTFIKLDVEGAEQDALNGMSGLVRDCRPRAAVSIYHKPADLWELPISVAELYGDAKLHIRQHGYNGFDTVLYAEPS
jgi:FkbM family methyltransferase